MNLNYYQEMKIWHFSLFHMQHHQERLSHICWISSAPFPRSSTAAIERALEQSWTLNASMRLVVLRSLNKVNLSILRSFVFVFVVLKKKKEGFSFDYF
jgi:hypothetical protein